VAPAARRRFGIGDNWAVSDVTLSVPGYDPQRGVVEVFGDAAGFRDLARLCLALSDPAVPPGGHIHLDPGVIPLSLESGPLMLARERG